MFLKFDPRPEKLVLVETSKSGTQSSSVSSGQSHSNTTF